MIPTCGAVRLPYLVACRCILLFYHLLHVRSYLAQGFFWLPNSPSCFPARLLHRTASMDLAIANLELKVAEKKAICLQFQEDLLTNKAEEREFKRRLREQEELKQRLRDNQRETKAMKTALKKAATEHRKWYKHLCSKKNPRASRALQDQGQQQHVNIQHMIYMVPGVG